MSFFAVTWWTGLVLLVLSFLIPEHSFALSACGAGCMLSALVQSWGRDP